MIQADDVHKVGDQFVFSARSVWIEELPDDRPTSRHFKRSPSQGLCDQGIPVWKSFDRAAEL